LFCIHHVTAHPSPETGKHCRHGVAHEPIQWKHTIQTG